MKIIQAFHALHSISANKRFLWRWLLQFLYKGVGTKLCTKFKIVRIGLFWRFQCKWTQNICKNVQYRKPSHAFPKIAYIPWYLVVGGVGAGPHELKKGTFFLCPWTKVYKFSTKNVHVQLRERLLSFLGKNFQQNLRSRLADGLNFHYIWFFLHAQAIPHIFRVQSRWNRQNRPILTILNLRVKSARFCAHPFK